MYKKIFSHSFSKAIKILIVDDDAGHTHLIKNKLSFLKNIQLVIDCVDTNKAYQDALTKLQTNSYDLLFVDQLLRDGYGLDLLKELRKKMEYIEPAIIFMSALQTNEVKEKALDLGACRFLSKETFTKREDPADQEIIINSIFEALKHKSFEKELYRIIHELKASEARWRATFETHPDAISITRLDGTYISINQGFQTLTGYGPENVGRTTPDSMWTILDNRKKLLTELKKTDVVTNLKSTFRCANGTLKVALISAKKIMIDGEECIVAIKRDITELEKQEKRTALYLKYIEAFQIMSDILNKNPDNIQAVVEKLKEILDLHSVTDIDIDPQGHVEVKGIATDLPAAIKLSLKKLRLLFAELPQAAKDRYQDSRIVTYTGAEELSQYLHTAYPDIALQLTNFASEPKNEVLLRIKSESTDSIILLRKKKGQHFDDTEFSHLEMLAKRVAEFRQKQFEIDYNKTTGIMTKEYLEKQIQNRLRSKKNATLLQLNLLGFTKKPTLQNDEIREKFIKQIISILNKNQSLNEIGVEISHARSSGNFYFLVPSLRESVYLKAVQEILALFKNNVFTVNKAVISISANMGVYPISCAKETNGVENIFKNISLCLLNLNEGAYRVYNPEMRLNADTFSELTEKVDRILNNNEVEARQQPIVTTSGINNSAENLARLNGLFPRDFLPIIKEYGWEDRLLENVFASTVNSLSLCNKPDMQFSLNISPSLFQHQEKLIAMAKNFIERAKEKNFLPSQFAFEILETEELFKDKKDRTQTEKTLQSIRNLGIKFFIDDVGKGYSSIHLVRSLAEKDIIQGIKIDKAITQELYRDDLNMKLLVNQAKMLGLSVTAEFVDTIYLLYKIKCLEEELQYTIKMQGWVFNKALPAQEYFSLEKTHYQQKIEAKYLAELEKTIQEQQHKNLSWVLHGLFLFYKDIRSEKIKVIEEYTENTKKTHLLDWQKILSIYQQLASSINMRLANE